MNELLRLYLDEDSMRASIVRALRARHFDVITALEAKLIGCPDEDNLQYAVTQGRALFSFNRGDFVRLHKAYLIDDRHHAGIIVSDQLATPVILKRLFRLLNSVSAADMRDQLVYLSNWR